MVGGKRREVRSAWMRVEGRNLAGEKAIRG